MGGGWLRTRVPYAAIDQVNEEDRTVRVAYFPQLSGGRQSRRVSWLTFEPIKKQEFLSDLRMRIDAAAAGKQKTGRVGGP
jgi:hypothetical protein